MKCVPIEGDHTESLPVRLQAEAMPASQAQLLSPERIRWYAWQWERGVVRVLNANSIPIDSRSAKIPGPTGCESTSDQDLAPHLHPPARFQKTRDGDTNLAHLWRKKRERPAW